MAGLFHAFQPTPFEQDCCCLALRDFGTLLHFRSAFGFSLSVVFIISARRSQSVRRPFEPAEQSGLSVEWGVQQLRSLRSRSSVRLWLRRLSRPIEVEKSLIGIDYRVLHFHS